MAFVVEDGTGLPTANSYASEADFVAYFADEGRDISDAGGVFTQALREAALVRATRYMETRFNYVGFKRSDDQNLAWPRIVDYPDPDGFEFDDVPIKLQRATFIYALEALYGELYPAGVSGAPSVAPATGGTVLAAPLRRVSKQVGQLNKTVEYAIGTSGYTGVLRPIPAADLMLRRLVTKCRETVRA